MGETREGLGQRQVVRDGHAAVDEGVIYGSRTLCFGSCVGNSVRKHVGIEKDVSCPVGAHSCSNLYGTILHAGSEKSLLC